MCDYITAILPGSADTPAMAELFDQHALGYTPVNNPSVLAFAEPGDVQILTTRKHCDCGTPLCGGTDDVDNAEAIQRELVKLRKRGWSQAKIDRWLIEKKQAAERSQIARRADLETQTPGLNKWLAFIHDVLATGRAARVGLFVHFYSGGIDSERINLNETQWWNVTELTAEVLAYLRSDTIHYFVKDSPKTAAGRGNA